ncbi:MAG: hypothetical protein N2C14_09310, partial [Planctomycetales bacterium]
LSRPPFRPPRMINLTSTARRLLESAANGRIGVRAFQKALPEIAAQIRADGASACLQYWGQSLNHDELENQTIVDPKLLNVIGRLANYSIQDGAKFHSGLIHTYGYLLSSLKTRFGYKHERWTSGVIESGLGMPKGTFSPTPESGTLLQNVTWLMSNLAFDTPPCDLAAPESAKAFAFDRLSRTRIVETISLQIGERKPRKVTIATDLVPFLQPTPTAQALLVYSYQTAGAHKLATCFPIDKNAMAIEVEQASEKNGIIRPRFNLHLDGLPKTGVRGEREIQEF